MQGEIGVTQVGPGHDGEICTARRQDGIGVIFAEDRPYGHHRQIRLA